MKKILLIILNFCLFLFSLAGKTQLSSAENFNDQMTVIPSMVFEIEDGGGGGSSGPIMSTNTYVNTLKGLIKGETYRTLKWRSGLIEKYYSFTIDEIKEVNGVYSNYFNRYFSKPLIESGGAEAFYTEEITEIESSTFTFAFTKSINYRIEHSMYVEAALSAYGITAGARVTNKAETSIGYTEEYLYTRKNTIERNRNVNYRLDANSSSYCPTGYSMSIGDRAKNYVIKLTYNEHRIWWWGTSTVGEKDRKSDIVAGNDGNKIATYIYKDAQLSDATYYLQ